MLSFGTLSSAAWLGAWLSRRAQSADTNWREGFGVVQAATLTLLALIIGFSFSMATNRYDQRKNFEEAEANAIGTEFVRADLLPAVDASKMRSLLRTYLDQRILFYTSLDTRHLEQVNDRTVQLQGELWSAVRAPAIAQPNPVTALAVSGANDVLNAQGYTQAAWWNRIPAAAWGLMGVIAVFCNVLVGYGMRGTRPARTLLLVLPLVTSTSFMLIADIDTPRHGIIRVMPQNLESLVRSLPNR